MKPINLFKRSGGDNGENLEQAEQHSMENITPNAHPSIAYTENDVAAHATELFRPVAQEVSMKGSTTVVIRPINGDADQAGPIYFPIQQRGDMYIQTSNIRLYVKIKIQNEAGAVPVAADGVGFSNLPGNSLFNKFEINIAGQLVGALENTHSNYKTYIESLLTYGKEARSGHMVASGWRIDTPGHFDDVKYGTNVAETKNAEGAVVPAVINNTRNEGLWQRRITGNPFDLCFPLHFDFFNSDRLFAPGMDMTLIATRISDDFVIMQPEASKKSWKIVLSDIKLHVPYIAVADNIVAHHKSLMNSGKSILIPIKKTEVLTFPFGTGLTNIIMPNLYMNRLPKSLILAMVETRSYNGYVHTNPYYFQNFGVEHVQLSRMGVAIPSEPYRPVWSPPDKAMYHRELRAFYDNIGIGESVFFKKEANSY